MAEVDLDELVTFRNVRVIRSTTTAVFCTVEDRSVWIPRGHVHGKLKCKGDRGNLLIRRSVAIDRGLLPASDAIEEPVAPHPDRSPERKAGDLPVANRAG